VVQRLTRVAKTAMTIV
jgi:hypothetical protein